VSARPQPAREGPILAPVPPPCGEGGGEADGWGIGAGGLTGLDLVSQQPPPDPGPARATLPTRGRDGRLNARRIANEPQRFQYPELFRPNLSSPSKPPVSFTHLAAWKGRKASDHCGGGGRSSGTGLEGVTPACPGTSIVGEPARRRRRTGTKRVFALRPAPPAAGKAGNSRPGSG